MIYVSIVKYCVKYKASNRNRQPQLKISTNMAKGMPRHHHNVDMSRLTCMLGSTLKTNFQWDFNCAKYNHCIGALTACD